LNEPLLKSEWVPDAEYAGVFVALAIRQAARDSRGQWRTFSRTGITHLISSGLHVTIFAALPDAQYAGSSNCRQTGAELGENSTSVGALLVTRLRKAGAMAITNSPAEQEIDG
jgi:hypothetical protein